jgi:hypothetical protein
MNPLPLWERVVPSEARNRVRGRRVSTNPLTRLAPSVLATLSHDGGKKAATQ